MNEDKMQQAARAVAKEKTTLKSEQKVMAMLALKKAFHENVSEETFDWQHFKLAKDVKQQYIGRVIDCNEFEKNAVVESAPVYNRVQPHEMC